MKSYKEKIPMDAKHIKEFVQAIEDADYLYNNYMAEEKFPTDNGSEGTRWNYINKQVKNNFPEGRFQIEVLHRGPWKFLGIYDRTTGYFYTIMREKNLTTLRRNANTRLFHYTNALSKLNEELRADYVVENEQLCLFPNMMYDEAGENTLENILNMLIKNIDGKIKRYVLICFDASHGQVTDIKAVIPALGMNYFKEENWTDFLLASYVTEDKCGQEEVSEDIILLEHRPKLERRKRNNENKEAK